MEIFGPAGGTAGPLATPLPPRQEITDHELTATQNSDTNDITQQIHQSKTARKTAKAALTRKMNEITELITDINNFQRVQSAYCEFEEVSKKFFLAHKNFHAKLSDEDDFEESKAYYEAEIRRTSAFEDKIKSWLNKNENTNTLNDGNDPSTEIKPSDSVSSVGTDCASKLSRK